MYICSMELANNNLNQDPRLLAFERLLNIMDDLREKCPWDKKQTIQSLRHLTIEETYELSDAILKGELPEIKKELGDVMDTMFNQDNIKQKGGAIALLTQNKLSRSSVYHQALILAMIPFLNSDLF